MSRFSIRVFSLGIVLFALAGVAFGMGRAAVLGIIPLALILGIYEAVRDRSRDDAPENQYVPGLNLARSARDADTAEDAPASDEPASGRRGPA